MTFYVLWGICFQNIRVFHSGRKAKAFLQTLSKQGKEGGLYMHRMGRPCLDWKPIAFTEAYTRNYR